MKTYLRKRQVAQRYGNITPRSVERAVEEGRICPPVYPMGPHTPLWDLAELEANERRAVMDRSGPSWRQRLLTELAAAPTRKEALRILQYPGPIDSLPEDEREKLLAEIQDIVAEKEKPE